MNLSGVASDLRQVTGSAQTQAQLRDTVASLDATMQKANSLLGTLGGRSHVPGVDAGATPYPMPNKNGVPQTVPGTPEPMASPNGSALNGGLSKILSSLVSVQFRLSYLNQLTVPSNNRLLTTDRGPQADVNAILLPRGNLSVMTGANDIGSGRTTYNLAAIKTFTPNIRIGGGVLYSQIGALATFDAGLVGRCV